MMLTTTKPLIKIYDDLIPPYLQDYFELVTLGINGGKEDFLYPTVPFKAKYESTARDEELQQSPMSFVHVLKSSTALSEHLENFAMPAQAAINHQGMTLKDIMVARIYITMPHETSLKHYAPHVDLPGEHMVVIYYVNDADGATVFFDNFGNIIQEVEPKKGRVLLFDGKIKHGGGIPKKGPRCIVNYDLHI